MFTGNVGGAAVGTVQLQMETGGEVLPETTIIVTEDTVGSLDNVAAHTFFRNCSKIVTEKSFQSSGIISMTA